jgi:tRNA(Ile)-lysidine synthase
MLDRFRQHLEKSRLIPEGARVLVGYSGGADSTCLLHLLFLTGIDVVAGHLHHGQRSEADKELELCAAFCEQLGVPFVSGHADVPRMASERKIGLEEAGRDARYEFFRQAAFETGCELIATAHTQSDHVETVVLNLSRGTGLNGLGGIPERRENIIRPLLLISREESRDYCTDRGLWFHDDPANIDTAFSRARVRLRVLPELRAINPSADVAIARLAGIAGEEDRFLNGMAAAALERAEIHLNGELRFLTVDTEVAFHRDVIESLPAVLFKRACRLACGALGGKLTWDQGELLLHALVGEAKGSVTGEGGTVVFEWDSEMLHVRQTAQSIPFRYGLTVPGETESEEFGWIFTAFEAPYSGSRPLRGSLQTELDVKKLKGQLYFRTPNPGDTMRPLGFSGTRKLSDLLSEAKLTRAARARLPIICDMVGPIWAPGVCLDERVAASSDTRNVLRVSFGPIGSNSSHNQGNVGSVSDVASPENPFSSETNE